MIADESRPDAGAFLSRLLRLDPAAVVRLRPASPGQVLIWARLPFDVLVSRGLRAAVARDVTVRASELLTAVGDGRGMPAPRDADWRWPLPSSPAVDVEETRYSITCRSWSKPVANGSMCRNGWSRPSCG
jgi:hypothetical protein